MVKLNVVSEDGNKVWATFQIGGFLTEFDLKTKSGNALISSNSFPYAMDVIESGNGNGFVATGGDDKFVRIWNLADLSLSREFQTNVGIPQGVAFVNDGQEVVFSSSSVEAPTSIFAADVKVGEIKKILNVEQPFVSVRSAGQGFVYNFGNKLVVASANDGSKISEFEFEEGISKFETSANSKWLTVADKKGYLWAINLINGERKQYSRYTIDDLNQIAISNDGTKVYVTDFKLRFWKTDSQRLELLNDFGGQAAFLRLSADEKYIVIGRNHQDIRVYETATGKGVFYGTDESSDFYVTNGWMKGNRLIYTTDGGVMVDGIFSKK
jgi:WD40 repeat protein